MMEHDEDWPDESIERRIEALRQSIRRVDVAELRGLAVERFPVVTDPWYEKFMLFLKDHESGEFYRAESPEGAEVVYCHDVGAGVWFLPGRGMGILLPKALAAMDGIVRTMGSASPS